MLTFGGQSVNNPDSRSQWLNPGIGSGKAGAAQTQKTQQDQPASSMRERYLLEKRGKAMSPIISNFSMPQNLAKDRKRQLYDSSATYKTLVPETFQQKEVYSRKTRDNQGTFKSPQPQATRKDNLIHQSQSKLIDGTIVRLSTADKQFKSFKSTYKNASSITFNHASARDLPRYNQGHTRNWQKDRDLYKADIFQADASQLYKTERVKNNKTQNQGDENANPYENMKTHYSSYNVAATETQVNRAQKRVTSPVFERHDSFENIDNEILSERDVGQYNTAKPQSRVKIFPGKKNKQTDSASKNLENKTQIQARRQQNRVANRSTMGLVTALDHDSYKNNAPQLQKPQKEKGEPVDVYAQLQTCLEREEQKKAALQFSQSGSLSIVGTMTGDAFKKLHEAKTKRMENRVNEVRRQTVLSTHPESKQHLQSYEDSGQCFAFKDEAIRPQKNKEAKMKNAQDVQKQIREKQAAINKQKIRQMNYERNMISSQPKPKFKF